MIHEAGTLQKQRSVADEQQFQARNGAILIAGVDFGKDDEARLA